MLTLEALTVGKQTKKNEGSRKAGSSKGQAFSGLRFAVNSKGQKTFKIADKIYEELGINEGKGFFQSNFRVDAEGNQVKEGGTLKNVYLVLVDDDNTLCKFFTKSKGVLKSKQFNASVLEKSLVELGVIDEPAEGQIEENKPFKQFIELEKVDFPDAEGVYGVFNLVPDSEGSDDEDDDVADMQDSDTETESQGESSDETNDASEDEAPKQAGGSILDSL